MPKYLIDTSFLLRLAEQGALRRSGPSELALGEFVLIRAVQFELESLAQRRPHARAKAAQRAIEAAAQLAVLDSSERGPTDDALVQMALKGGYGVATLDQRLRRRLRALRVPVLTLRASRLLRESPR